MTINNNNNVSQCVTMYAMKFTPDFYSKYLVLSD